MATGNLTLLREYFEQKKPMLGTGIKELDTVPHESFADALDDYIEESLPLDKTVEGGLYRRGGGGLYYPENPETVERYTQEEWKEHKKTCPNCSKK